MKDLCGCGKMTAPAKLCCFNWHRSFLIPWKTNHLARNKMVPLEITMRAVCTLSGKSLPTAVCFKVGFCGTTFLLPSSPMAALTYEGLLVVWNKLFFIHGFAGLAQRTSHHYECIRETLLEFYPLFAASAGWGPSLLGAVQFLTVINSMTFTAQMDGEDKISKLGCWVELGDGVPKPETRTAFLTKMQSWSDHKWRHVYRVMETSKKEAEILADEVGIQDDGPVHQVLEDIESLLEMIQSTLEEEIVNVAVGLLPEQLSQ